MKPTLKAGLIVLTAAFSLAACKQEVKNASASGASACRETGSESRCTQTSLAVSRIIVQPQYRLRQAAQDAHPGGKAFRIDFPWRTEAAKDEGIVRQPMLTAR